MTQTNTKLPREAFKTNRDYEEYQSFLKMIEKKGNMNTPCKKCNTLGKPCCEEHNGKLATQTNTTQNKEELEVKDILENFATQVSLCHKRGVEPNINPWADLLITTIKHDKSLSQAHQSGIEEARKAILEEVRSLPRYPTTEMATYENGYNEGHNNAIIDIIQMLERQKLSILEGEK